MKRIAFIDAEISAKGKILDLGAVKYDGSVFHSSKIPDFLRFIDDCEYLCGHNIIEHDLKYLNLFLPRKFPAIDTLYLSPLLFPDKPYHRLLKDDKIDSEELNNPLSDARKCKILYEDEAVAFNALPEPVRELYYELTSADHHFENFYKSVDYTPGGWRFPFFRRQSLSANYMAVLDSLVCPDCDVEHFLKHNSVECAYAASLIRTGDRNSITPPWVLKNYPAVERIMHRLRSSSCGKTTCPYCSAALDPVKALKKWFGYDAFRKFGGEALQEKAVSSAMAGESLLAIFPTGGGKSLTFQLPALVAGETERGLTIVISPLQSLMKDQVENLEKKGIADAVYINGLLSPVERQNALERVRNGEASMLYIAPEQLRSKTIEKILLSRTVSRFVIDEAHCFSAWGQDFRVEYLHIADFIKSLQELKGLDTPIPVSCFTATAKPKVVSDICDYFRDRLGLQLKHFTTDAERTNLHYTVLYRGNNEEKYQTLRNLVNDSVCPTIVYVTRTKTAEDLAQRLTCDGIQSLAFHGQMETRAKVHAQEAFMENSVRVIVATSAFGMGVDKSDVGLVIHYEISDSLENYIQEAGRAGRDIHSEADCYVLYNDDDLNRHFILLNQTKLTLSEINQVWRAVKNLTQRRDNISISALEIARKAGWDDIRDVETKVKSAIAALENAGYIRRGMNSPRIFATSIRPQNMDQASEAINSDVNMSDDEKRAAIRIIKSMISERSRAMAGTAEAESRIDYLSDMLGIETGKVIRVVEKMRSSKILSTDNDMTAYIRNNLLQRLEPMLRIEEFLLTVLESSPQSQYGLKELNENALESEEVGKSTVKDIRTILFFWMIEGYIVKSTLSEEYIHIKPQIELKKFRERFELRCAVSRYIVWSFRKLSMDRQGDEKELRFSLVSLMDKFNQEHALLGDLHAEIADVEESLLFLAKCGIVTIEGGFMVLYNKLQIERLNHDNRSRYKKDDYMNLDAFYKQRIQQIHIVGKYANLMVSDEKAALGFVHDYFVMDFRAFIRKYFDGREQQEISRNVSPQKYRDIFGSLTPAQRSVIEDKDSRFIVVPAGPGSGKTYLLVRKLASLILMEDVKSEQLLMLTFSRAAATEFKKRLRDLIGNAAEYVEIRTFHSYCFDLLGKIGSVDDSDEVVKKAVESIRSGEVERCRITKSILVIDEAQDMSEEEFALVQELVRNNEDLRVIAVGDDDQNIYEFRGSDSKYMGSLIRDYGAMVYSMLDNFRSCVPVIDFANLFVRTIGGRLKLNPIVCVNRELEGSVRLTRHKNENYEFAAVKELISDNLSGTTAVLTLTNDDALIVCASLIRAGRKARLIQSNDSFALNDLAELHCFYSDIRANCSTVIPDDVWAHAKRLVEEEYGSGRSFQTAMDCISSFENEYPRGKYVSDLFNFFRESQLSDFSRHGKDEVVVSTIHKSKGCEFDNAYLVLRKMPEPTDKDRRAVYVGMTRAKKHLSVHFDNGIFDAMGLQNVAVDTTEWPVPDELSLQMSHRDVNLAFFKGKGELISRLRSGDELTVSGDVLFTQINGYSQPVAKFSEAFRHKIEKFAKFGYVPVASKVRFLLFWRYENPDTSESAPRYIEIPILLPTVKLVKQGNATLAE